MRGGEQRLDDAVAAWSRDGNRAWLVDGARRGEPFLQVSAPAPGSVLEWELRQLAELGYLQLGPLWIPVAWLRDGARYRTEVTRIAAHVAARTAGSGVAPSEYFAKAAAELAPLLQLWPHVVAVPTDARLTVDEMILLRAVPVHPLGVVAAPAFADGALRSPAEFFWHDVDHARFKLRADLAAAGVDVPDAYRNGSTWDATTGRHRTFVAVAEARGRSALRSSFAAAPARLGLARRLLAGIDGLADRALTEAARWLLFEIVHEKSHPFSVPVLTRELGRTAHQDKLQAKCARGFFGDDGPGPAVAARLRDAAIWLRRLVAEPVR